MRSSVIHVPYTPPFDWPAMLRFFALRAIPGSEEVAGGAYCRTIRQDSEAGIVQISAEDDALRAEFWLPSITPSGEASARLRNLFDLDADVAAISAHLSRDPTLAGLVAQRPAPRIPGGWNPFEIAPRGAGPANFSSSGVRPGGATCRAMRRGACGESFSGVGAHLSDP